MRNKSLFNLNPISWTRSWTELCGCVPHPSVYEQMIKQYGEPHRHYHTLQHLGECLELLSSLQLGLQSNAEIEIALWFHDAVYDPRRHDNEEQSGQWAQQVIQDLGVEADVSLRIRALILATRHDATPTNLTAQTLVDIDLAILGASEIRFDEYERQVRQEYKWVPEADFYKARQRILNVFLARPWIYSTAYFQANFEEGARQNILRSIAAHPSV
jgi:predicted metal-dependent HD superfamily phosphohydrolase